MQLVESYVLFHGNHLLLVNNPVIVVGLLFMNLDGDVIHHADLVDSHWGPQTIGDDNGFQRFAEIWE